MRLLTSSSSLSKLQRLMVTTTNLSIHNNHNFGQKGQKIIRDLSSFRGAGAPAGSDKNASVRHQRSRFQIPHRENPRLRVNAVSILHSDYTDDGVGDDPFQDDDDEDDDNDNSDDAFAKLIQEEERLEREKRARWEAQSRIPRETVIHSETGRAYGRGARKTARAQVWIEPGTGEVTVNKHFSLIDYFERESDRAMILDPFVVTETCGKYDIIANVRGGGKRGQAGAVRLGVARALNHYNPELYRPTLKYKGFLTRDSRKVERKKIGLKKARKAPQWVRR